MTQLYLRTVAFVGDLKSSIVSVRLTEILQFFGKFCKLQIGQHNNKKGFFLRNMFFSILELKSLFLSKDQCLIKLTMPICPICFPTISHTLSTSFWLYSKLVKLICLGGDVIHTTPMPSKAYNVMPKKTGKFDHPANAGRFSV